MNSAQGTYDKAFGFEINEKNTLSFHDMIFDTKSNTNKIWCMVNNKNKPIAQNTLFYNFLSCMFLGIVEIKNEFIKQKTMKELMYSLVNTEIPTKTIDVRYSKRVYFVHSYAVRQNIIQILKEGSELFKKTITFLLENVADIKKGEIENKDELVKLGVEKDVRSKTWNNFELFKEHAHYINKMKQDNTLISDEVRKIIKKKILSGDNTWKQNSKIQNMRIKFRNNLMEQVIEEYGSTMLKDNQFRFPQAAHIISVKRCIKDDMWDLIVDPNNGILIDPNSHTLMDHTKTQTHIEESGRIIVDGETIGVIHKKYLTPQRVGYIKNY